MVYMSVRYGLHPRGFLRLKLLYFVIIFLKNHQVSVERRRLFHQEIFEPFSEGEIALKFFKFQNS